MADSETEQKLTMKAVIDEVIIKPTAISPIIVNFLNGEVKEKKAKKLKCNIFYDPKKDKRVLALSDNSIVYKGYQPDSADSLTYTMFALHNKKTGKVRLIQAEHWDVAPVVFPQDDLSDESESESENAVSKSAILNKQFGSKKAKRQTEQYERMMINVSSMTNQLEQSVSNVDITNESLAAKEAENAPDDTIPPRNDKAVTVDEVYNVEDFIPNDKLKCLLDTMDDILKAETTGNSEFYVKSKLAIATHHDYHRKLAILEYINGVAKWMSMSIRAGKSKTDSLCPTAPSVSDYIVKTYSMTSTNGRVRPQSIKDKAVMHCMVLALMILGYKLDLELFSKHINANYGTKKLTQLAAVIGASIDPTNKTTIILKIPLAARPKLIKRKRK